MKIGGNYSYKPPVALKNPPVPPKTAGKQTCLLCFAMFLLCFAMFLLCFCYALAMFCYVLLCQSEAHRSMRVAVDGANAGVETNLIATVST